MKHLFVQIAGYSYLSHTEILRSLRLAIPLLLPARWLSMPPSPRVLAGLAFLDWRVRSFSRIAEVGVDAFALREGLVGSLSHLMTFTCRLPVATFRM